MIKKKESDEDETSESEEEDYDQENFNHQPKYYNSDSESERSFEREQQKLKSRYDDPDFDGESDFFENEEEEDLESLELEEKKQIKKPLPIKEEKQKETKIIQNSHCEIYVDNLPFEKNEIFIKNFFAKINKNVIFVKLLKDLKTNISKGRAFVKFITYNDALSIINEGDIYMNGRKLRISLVEKDKVYEKIKTNSNDGEKFTQEKKVNKDNKFHSYNTHQKIFNKNKEQNFEFNKSNTIFVKNLPDVNLEESKIKKVFKKFGNITSVRLMKKDDNTLKNFCYVDFENSETVDEILKSGNFKIGGKDLIVEKAKSSFNQTVFNESKTLKKKRKREIKEKEQKKLEKENKMKGIEINNFEQEDL
jgi:RNA recognition motif-containing protein